MPSYRDKETAILPLPAFVTVEAPDQVDRPAEEQTVSSRRTFKDWEHDTMTNMNRMAADEKYRREIAARQS